MTEFEYVVPSMSVYQSRRIFHTKQRNRYESLEEWFHRVFKNLNDCDYGKLADFILIDKFISGLDSETIEKFPQNERLTVNEVVSSIRLQRNDANGLIHETSEDTTHFLAVEDIKVEVSEKICWFLF